MIRPGAGRSEEGYDRCRVAERKSRAKRVQPGSLEAEAVMLLLKSGLSPYVKVSPSQTHLPMAPSDWQTRSCHQHDHFDMPAAEAGVQAQGNVLWLQLESAGLSAS